jgi:hypothetical protein
MAVHRAHERDGQGIRDGYRWSGEPGTCPTSFFPWGRDSGTGRSRQPFRQQGIGSGDIIRNGGGNYPRNVLGEFLKAEPRLVRCTGAPRVARGVGGWGASATVVQIIANPSSTAKSSLGYRVSGAPTKEWYMRKG